MEQVIPQPCTRMTEEEYLRMEEAAETRHEYRDGEIIDMAGGSFNHGVIAVNLIGELRNSLRGKPFQTLGSDLRVKVSNTGSYCYPDAMIVCGPPAFDPPDRKTTINNPQIIMEVTSTSTESNDRGYKFSDYRRIESLQEYFLISQERGQVESFYRQSDGVWAIGPTVTQLDRGVKLRSLGMEILLSEIYAGVEFPAVPTKVPPAE